MGITEHDLGYTQWFIFIHGHQAFGLLKVREDSHFSQFVTSSTIQTASVINARDLIGIAARRQLLQRVI